jgi:hypothetical protein
MLLMKRVQLLWAVPGAVTMRLPGLEDQQLLSSQHSSQTAAASAVALVQRVVFCQPGRRRIRCLSQASSDSL